METNARPSLSEKDYFRRLLLAVGVVLAVGLLVAFFWISIHVWLAVFAGVLVAVFLSTLTRWVAKATHISRGWALATVIIVLLGVAVLGGWMLIPRVAEQFSELSQRMPKAIEQIEQRVTEWGWTRYLPQNVPASSEWTSGVGKLVGNLAGYLSVSVEAVATFFVIIFLGIYLAASPRLYVNGLVRLFPIPKRERVRDVTDKVGTTLGHWLLGQMLSMTVVGTLVTVGLTLLGIPLALALGVLAGIFNFIPFIGSLFSAVPAVMLAFLVSPLHPVYVII
ncbi:MAG TPA: AI-2E family transporter, partial [Clostridia bacterium]|nr:AI-2E family transporter [Clostridia bacterium]